MLSLFLKKFFARVVNCLIIPGFAVVTCTVFSLSSFLLTFPGLTKVCYNNNIVLGSLNLHKLFFFFLFQAVNNLKEMGFQEEEIIMALKATGNNQEAAVSVKHAATCIQVVCYYL